MNVRTFIIGTLCAVLSGTQLWASASPSPSGAGEGAGAGANRHIPSKIDPDHTVTTGVPVHHSDTLPHSQPTSEMPTYDTVFDNFKDAVKSGKTSLVKSLFNVRYNVFTDDHAEMRVGHDDYFSVTLRYPLDGGIHASWDQPFTRNGEIDVEVQVNSESFNRLSQTKGGSTRRSVQALQGAIKDELLGKWRQYLRGKNIDPHSQTLKEWFQSVIEFRVTPSTTAVILLLGLFKHFYEHRSDTEVWAYAYSVAKIMIRLLQTWRIEKGDPKASLLSAAPKEFKTLLKKASTALGNTEDYLEKTLTSFLDTILGKGTLKFDEDGNISAGVGIKVARISCSNPREFEEAIRTAVGSKSTDVSNIDIQLFVKDEQAFSDPEVVIPKLLTFAKKPQSLCTIDHASVFRYDPSTPGNHPLGNDQAFLQAVNSKIRNDRVHGIYIVKGTNNKFYYIDESLDFVETLKVALKVLFSGLDEVLRKRWSMIKDKAEQMKNDALKAKDRDFALASQFARIEGGMVNIILGDLSQGVLFEGINYRFIGKEIEEKILAEQKKYHKTMAQAFEKWIEAIEGLPGLDAAIKKINQMKSKKIEVFSKELKKHDNEIRTKEGFARVDDGGIAATVANEGLRGKYIRYAFIRKQVDCVRSLPSDKDGWFKFCQENGCEPNLEAYLKRCVKWHKKAAGLSDSVDLASYEKEFAKSNDEKASGEANHLIEACLRHLKLRGEAFDMARRLADTQVQQRFETHRRYLHDVFQSLGSSDAGASDLSPPAEKGSSPAEKGSSKFDLSSDLPLKEEGPKVIAMGETDGDENELKEFRNKVVAHAKELLGSILEDLDKARYNSLSTGEFDVLRLREMELFYRVTPGNVQKDEKKKGSSKKAPKKPFGLIPFIRDNRPSSVSMSELAELKWAENLRKELQKQWSYMRMAHAFVSEVEEQQSLIAADEKILKDAPTFSKTEPGTRKELNNNKFVRKARRYVAIMSRSGSYLKSGGHKNLALWGAFGKTALRRAIALEKRIAYSSRNQLLTSFLIDAIQEISGVEEE